MAKLDVSDLKVGQVVQATFWPNPKEESRFSLRATHLDGERAPKAVLTSDPKIVAGAPCMVRILTIEKPERNDHGYIEVGYEGPAPFAIEGVYLDPWVARKLQVLLESGLNILLDGPQGSGKSVLVRTLAETLGMELVFFNCGAVIEASDFFATIQVRASESGAPVTDFVKTEILEAIENASETPEKRYLVFLDELNRCPENARNALMPMLDSFRRVYHPIEARFVPIPDNVQFVAAVNRGASFTATFGIDAAQLDRFAPLQVDYLPPEEEVKLLRRRHPDLGRPILERLVAVASAIRDSDELMRGLSVRATEEACIYLSHPLMSAASGDAVLEEVIKSSFCGRFDGRWDDSTSEAGAAWHVAQRVLRETKA